VPPKIYSSGKIKNIQISIKSTKWATMKRKSTGTSSSSKKTARDTYNPDTGRWSSQVARTSAAAATSRVVQRAVQQVLEKKGVDLYPNPEAVVATTNTNDNIYLVNGIQTGSGSWQRIGRKARLRSVRVKGVIRHTYAAAATTGDQLANYARMVIVFDKQPNSGSIPTFETIFGITEASGTELSMVNAPPRYDNMDRFRILRDVTWSFNPCANSVTSGTTQSVTCYRDFDEYIKLGNLECNYSGPNAGIADISTGALYVLFRAGENAATNEIDLPYRWMARLRFTD